MDMKGFYIKKKRTAHAVNKWKVYWLKRRKGECILMRMQNIERMKESVSVSIPRPHHTPTRNEKIWKIIMLYQFAVVINTAIGLYIFCSFGVILSRPLYTMRKLSAHKAMKELGFCDQYSTSYGEFTIFWFKILTKLR